MSDLLETSRRSIGRTVAIDLRAALQDAAVIAEARAILVGSANRGSTAEEREAAETWLTHALHEEPNFDNHASVVARKRRLPEPRRALTVRRPQPAPKPVGSSKNCGARAASAPAMEIGFARIIATVMQLSLGLRP